jgi:hypothetical protein
VTTTLENPEFLDRLAIDRAAAARLFTEARSATSFTDEPVSAGQLRAIYELLEPRFERLPRLYYDQVVRHV